MMPDQLLAIWLAFTCGFALGGLVFWVRAELADFRRSRDEHLRQGEQFRVPVMFGDVDAPPVNDDLSHELAVYRDHLEELLGLSDANEGKYAVVQGDEILGPFDTYDAALAAAYGRYGLGRFLVRMIERVETVHYFSRPI